MSRKVLKLLLFLNSCALIFALSLATEHRAYAYGDPGSGLLILQGIGSAVMGVLFVCRRKLGKLFYRPKPGSDPEAAAAIDPQLTHE